VVVIWGIVGAVLYSNGRKKLREVNPTPERTVDTLKNVPDALKGVIKYPARVKCAVLAWTALQNGLEKGGSSDP
jgi:NifU-like protein involved in Fe-S cluster formation